MGQAGEVTVTRCPPAYAAASDADIGDEARAAIREYHDRRRESDDRWFDWKRQGKRRHGKAKQADEA